MVDTPFNKYMFVKTIDNSHSCMVLILIKIQNTLDNVRVT
jgi:hypothetical protein